MIFNIFNRKKKNETRRRRPQWDQFVATRGRRDRLDMFDVARYGRRGEGKMLTMYQLLKMSEEEFDDTVEYYLENNTPRKPQYTERREVRIRKLFNSTSQDHPIQ